MKLLNSIGKKIYLIVFVSLSAVVFLALISLNFFGKINETAEAKQEAFQYEIWTKDVILSFNDYVRAGDEQNFKKAVELVTDQRQIFFSFNDN